MADELAPKIPKAETRRLIGIVLIVIGALMWFGGPAVSTLGTALVSAGAILHLWGSLLGHLRTIEDRQIDIQRRLPPG
ncbi:MAG: hypothetical protein B7Y35_06110 [Sphingomonadales bacterium 28-64-96]|nr:MAG: hypothetical protein B7Y35_06110 [Sphingomonadales bacterium 28-64-96]